MVGAFGTAQQPIGIGAYAGGGCIKGVVNAGLVANGACVLGPSTTQTQSLNPQQPFIAPLGTDYAVVAVATTAPCTGGQLSYAVASATAGMWTQATCPACPGQMCTGVGGGATLPAVIASPDNTLAIITWYEGTKPLDPIGDCSGKAVPGSLRVGAAAASTSPSPPVATTLSSQSTAVRPAAMATFQNQTLVAAPDGAAASLWAVSGGTPLMVSGPTTISGLAGARALSMAVAGDGSGQIAIVAELGCTPMTTIALTLGTVTGPFTAPITVAQASSGNFAVQPTVNWVAAGSPTSTEASWIVSWIAGGGGTHVLAQRYDEMGNPFGEQIDPGAPAWAAGVLPDGTLFAFEQPPGKSGTFLDVALGCE
jgi:hypothetical protein